MTPRFAPFKIAPDLIKALVGLETAIAAGGLEHSLAELVQLRAAQINRCAFCITCMPPPPVTMARPRCASTCSTPGVNRRSTPTANAQR